MAAPEREEEALAEELLRVLQDDSPEPPDDLEHRTLAKVRASLTLRDLVDLSTIVFVLRFCAPILDLIAALFGAETTSNDRRDHDE